MLKATIRCSCGCKYELLSTSEHKTVQCPNCSETFKESDKLIQILELFASMDSEKNAEDFWLNDKPFGRHELQLVTLSEFDIIMQPAE